MNKAPGTFQAADRSRRLLRWMATVLVCVMAIVFCLMRWGGRLLESNDSLPAQVDAAIVLEGSLAGERVRLAGAMDLLRQGASDRVLLTLPASSYWGEPVPPMARHFLEASYGHGLAERVDFCQVGADVDSTLQEAQAIDACIQQHQWKKIAVVTSNYHTRRAGMIWRRVMRKRNPNLQIWVHAVDDPEFQANGWWRKRLWAKTWLLEFTKLIWTVTVGR